MRVTTIILTAIACMLITTGFTMLILDLAGNYGVNVDTTKLDSINKLNDTYQLGVDAGKQFDQNTETLSQEGVDPSDTGWKLLSSGKILFQSVSIIPSVVTQMATILHIPAWLIAGFMAILLLTLVIGVIALITGMVRGILN